MFIEAITLRDFKSYAHQKFEFSAPTSRKNVSLVGAENGFGKTSLLEAIMLCLYGRDGLTYLPRATMVQGDESKLLLSYDNFMERAFHGLALEAGRDSASVTVRLNSDASRIDITRTWYFWGNGKHRAADEEVTIYVDGSPLPIGRFDRDQKDEIYRNFIAKAFVPVYLAPFFLFDGEQVQRLAQRDMAAQVKVGIEGLLGVATLRELQEDLRAYINNRRAGLSAQADQNLFSGSAELDQLQGQLRVMRAEVAEIEAQLPGLHAAMENKAKQINAMLSGNTATADELKDARGRAESHKVRLHERLSRLLRDDLALCIAGRSLHASLRARLEVEEITENWTTNREQGRANFDRLKEEFHSASPEQPFSNAQAIWLEQQLERAWNAIWYPPPSGAVEDARHLILSPRERTSAITRSLALFQMGLGDVEKVLQEYAEAEQDVTKAESRLRSLLPIQDQANRAMKEFREAQDSESAAKARQAELQRMADAVGAQLANKQAEVERSRHAAAQSEPIRRKLEKAATLARGIDAMIGDMYPTKISEVAKVMTRVYKRLAHKDLLHRVEVSPDCEVKLLDRHGNDLQRYDASAGESQIFAIALISAIAEVAAANVPIVVDTPLGRLDERHRLGVLRHLAQLPNQVILLSATDEVTGQYYEEIKGRVAKQYLVSFEELDNRIGVSTAKEGYWGQA